MPPARASCPPPVARADLHPEFQRAIENVEARAHGVGDGLFERRYGLPGDGLVRPHVDGGPSAIDRRVRDGHAGHRAGPRAAHARDVDRRIHVVGAPVAVRSATWVRVRGASASRTHRIPTASAAMAAGTSHCCQCRRPIHSKVFRSQGAPPITPRAISSSRAATAASARSPIAVTTAAGTAAGAAVGGRGGVTMSAGTGVGHAPPSDSSAGRASVPATRTSRRCSGRPVRSSICLPTSGGPGG